MKFLWGTMMATVLVALTASVAQAELKGEVFSELERQIIQRHPALNESSWTVALC